MRTTIAQRTTRSSRWLALAQSLSPGTSTRRRGASLVTPYRVQLSPRAQRDLDALPAHVLGRVRTAIDGLPATPRPRGAKKLLSYTDRYRIRVGDWRVVYEVHDDVTFVLVLQVGHRREVYRR